MNLFNKYFFLRRNGEILGPLPAKRLDDMYRAGQLSDEAELSVDKVNWQSLTGVLYRDAQSPVPDVPQKKKLSLPQKFQEDEAAEQPEFTPVAEPPAPPQELEPVMPEEPERRISPGLLIGHTLQMLWNTPDMLGKIEPAGLRSTICFVYLPAFLFAYAVSVLAAVSVGCFFGDFVLKIVFMLLFSASVLLIFLIEFLLLRVLFGIHSGLAKSDFLMSAMTSINFGALTCIGSLHYALAVLSPSGVYPFWVLCISGTFTLFAACFSFANLAAGLRIGLASFYDLRPRFAVWFSSLLLFQYFGLLKAGEFLFRHFAK